MVKLEADRDRSDKHFVDDPMGDAGFPVEVELAVTAGCLRPRPDPTFPGNLDTTENALDEGNAPQRPPPIPGSGSL